MEIEKYLISTFSNGVRAVCCRAPGLVSYTGIAINAGSSSESPDKHGLAHFVEHTVFKGTRHRSSWHISNRMEVVGGELNAYTSKEETVIHTSAPAGYVDRALELLSDLILNATFPEREIVKEKEVIIEEIHSYQDSPSDSVFDEFEELIYAGSPLAHNILGSPESVRGLHSSDALDFISENYRGKNLVVYCCAPGNPAKNMKLVEKYFSTMPALEKEENREAVIIPPCFNEVRNRATHQANTIVGARLFGRRDPRRHALFLLNNYLGGPCMNSRLNQEIRDRRGLVYTVDSYVSLLRETGLFTVYFGSDKSTVDKCIAIIRNELDRLAQSPLSERRFKAARDQYCGQLTVSSDHHESRAMSLAKSLMYYDEIHDIAYTAERIRAVTAEEMRQAAELILTSGLSRLSLY